MARNAGEEIFESLGEERTVVEESQFVIETKESENIQTQHLAPAAAFEYFHGKIYETSQREKTDYSLADQVEKRVESPFQRFARLRAELQELQSDVAVMLQDDQKHSKPYENIWSTLQQETNHLLHNLNDLNGQINQLSAHEQPINSSTQSLERLAKQAASLASTDSLNNSQNQTKSLESHSPLSTLELRIAALESLLGSASNSLDLEGFVGVTVHGRSFPLLEKLTLLERKVNMLDPTTLESIRTKAHTLKSELEEIQRERLRSGGAAHKVLESAKKIETLYDNAAHITAVSEDLPAVILRLKTLETLHHEAASFHVRLTNATEILTSLSAEVESNSETLATLNAGFLENIAIIQKNLSELNSRIPESS